jgi:hypothetical protein
MTASPDEKKYWDVSAKRWQKHGHDRLYFNDSQGKAIAIWDIKNQSWIKPPPDETGKTYLMKAYKADMAGRSEVVSAGPTEDELEDYRRALAAQDEDDEREKREWRQSATGYIVVSGRYDHRIMAIVPVQEAIARGRARYGEDWDSYEGREFKNWQEVEEFVNSFE